MATDWAKDVRKYAANADDAVIAGIVRYCGIALRNRDSSLVSFSDPKELDRVRNNFLKKKLGLAHTDEVLNAAIAKVGEQMKADRTKNRVTVYYLLAEAHNKLDLFVKAAAAKAAKAPAKAEKAPKADKPASKGKAAGTAALAGAAVAAAGAKPAKTAAKSKDTAPAKTAVAKPAPAKAEPKAAPAKKAAAPKAEKAAPAKAAKAAPAKAAPKAKSATAKAAGAATAAAGGAALLAANLGDKAAGTASKAKDAAADTVDAVKDTAAKGAAAVASAASAAGDAASAAVSGAADLAGKAAGAVGDAAGSAVDAVGAGAAAVAGAGAAAVAGAAGLASGAADKLGSAASGAVSQLTGTLGDDDDSSGLGWLWWLLGALLVAFGIWWLMFRTPADSAASAPAAEASVAADSAAASGAIDLAAAPAEGSVTIPTGAGVTSELREGKPVVKVYFDTGKVDVVPAFGATAGGLKAWLDGHAGSSLAISGYNDASGNAAANAELSKNRAKAVQAALVASGIPEASVLLVKPENTTDTSVAKDAARRVEVVVK